MQLNRFHPVGLDGGKCGAGLGAQFGSLLDRLRLSVFLGTDLIDQPEAFSFLGSDEVSLVKHSLGRTAAGHLPQHQVGQVGHRNSQPDFVQPDLPAGPGHAVIARQRQDVAAGDRMAGNGAERVIGVIEESELEIARMVSGESGLLRIGMQCIFCYKWLPRVMKIFQEKFSNVEVEIGSSQDTIEELECKKFDLIITAIATESDHVTYSPLFADQMVCIMGTSHPLSARPYICYEDFRGDNLLCHAEKEKSRLYQIFLKPRGIEPRRFMTIGQPQAIIEMVAAGFGIAIMPRWAVKSALDANAITARPLTKGRLPLTWWAASLKNNQPPVFQEGFIHMVARMNPAKQSINSQIEGFQRQGSKHDGQRSAVISA